MLHFVLWLCDLVAALIQLANFLLIGSLVVTLLYGALLAIVHPGGN